MYAQNAGEDDPLLFDDFQELCESIGDVPLDFGSPDHVQRVLNALPFVQVNKCMSEKVKWTRWGSHQDAALDFLPNLPFKKMPGQSNPAS